MRWLNRCNGSNQQKNSHAKPRGYFENNEKVQPDLKNLTNQLQSLSRNHLFRHSGINNPNLLFRQLC